MQSRRQFLTSSASFVAGLGFRQAALAEQTKPEGPKLWSTKFIDEVKLVQPAPFLAPVPVRTKVEVIDKDPDRLQDKKQQLHSQLNLQIKLLRISNELAKTPQAKRPAVLEELDSMLFQKDHANKLSANDINTLSAEFGKHREENRYAEALTGASLVSGYIAGKAPHPYVKVGAALTSIGTGYLATTVDDLIAPEHKKDVNTDGLVNTISYIAMKGLQENCKNIPKEDTEVIRKILIENGLDDSCLNKDIDIKKLPKHLRKPASIIAKAAQEGREPSSKEMKAANDALEKDTSEIYKDAFTPEMETGPDGKPKKKELTAEEKEALRIKQAKIANEIQSGVFLVDFIATDIFKNPKLGSGVTKIYQSYNIIAGLSAKWNEDPRLIDCLTVAADFTKAFKLLASIAFNQPDPVQVALENIQKTLDSVRTEMHDRFDQVVKTQEEILNELQKIGTDVNKIQSTLDQLAKTHNINDGDGRIRDAEYYRHEIAKALESLSSANDTLRVTKRLSDDKITTAVESLVIHAADTSTYNAFTRNDAERFTNVRREWDPEYTKNMFRSSGVSLNYLCGYIPAIYAQAGRPNQVKGTLKNVAVYIDGVNDFTRARKDFPQLEESLFAPKAEKLSALGEEISREYAQVFNKEGVSAVKTAIENSFGTFIRPYLDLALKQLNKKYEGKITAPDLWPIYPFGHPVLQPIANGGEMPEGHYRYYRIAPLSEKNRELKGGNFPPSPTLNENYSYTHEIPQKAAFSGPNVRHDYKCIGERLTMSRLPFAYAQSYALITHSPIKDEPTQKVYSNNYFRTGYHVKFISGEYSGQNIPYVRYLTRVDNPNHNELAIDCPLNTLAVGSKSFANKIHPSGMKHSDGEAFERFMYEQTNIQHTKLRNEYLELLEAALKNASNLYKPEEIPNESTLPEDQKMIWQQRKDAFANKQDFEALSSGLGYIAGLSMQMRGNHPQLCADFAKKAHASIMGDMDSLFETIIELLNPVDKENKPIAPIDKPIKEYLEEGLKKRLGTKLDSFIAEHLKHEHSVELLEFKAATRALKDVEMLKEPEAQKNSALGR